MKRIKAVFTVLLCFTIKFTVAQNSMWQYFEMNGNECRIFVTKGNSRIIVPSHCFMLNGKIYLGKLKISYREYKDQLDFILGGLDLRYNIDGNLKYLQSGGMFEILISASDKNSLELDFAKNKTVTVKFVVDPKFDVEGLEPFYYESKARKWTKNTRYGNDKRSNKPVSENKGDLWQDDPRIVSNGDGEYIDDGDNDCYYISVADKADPTKFVDSLICPGNYSILDNRYYQYLSDQAYKTMQIDKMGLYNYDKIFEEDKSIPMFVNLKTKDGKKLQITDRMFVVYKNSNTSIYYHQSDLDSNFKLIPRNDIVIFIYNNDGTIYKVPDNFWTNIDIRTMRGKTIDLPFDKLKLATISKEQFASVTGIR